jgi:hypothetical protein
VAIVVARFRPKLERVDKFNRTPQYQILWKSTQPLSFCYMQTDRQHDEASNIHVSANLFANAPELLSQSSAEYRQNVVYIKYLRRWTVSNIISL